MSDKPRILVVAAHLPDFMQLAKITLYQIRAKYCEKHGYTFRIKTGDWKMPACHPVSWDRFAFMRDLLETGDWDWAWCGGADTLNTNFHIRLEDRIDDNFHVIAAADWCAPVQADSFLVRASKEGIGWMNDILGLYEQYRKHPWVENAAMIDTRQKYQDAGVLKIVPQCELNSYPYHLFEAKYPGQQKVKEGKDYFGHRGRWQPGDFLIHWPSLPYVQRVREAELTVPKIVGYGRNP